MRSMEHQVKFPYFLAGGKLLYNIMLVSAIMHGSAIGIRTYITSLSYLTPSHSSRLLQSPRLSFLSHTEIQNYGTLYKFVCHPCTGAVLIFSALFQFQYVCCQSTPLNSFSSKSDFSLRLTQLPISQGLHLPLTKHLPRVGLSIFCSLSHFLI